MTKKQYNYLKIGFTAVVIILLGKYLYANKEAFEILAEVSTTFLVLIYLLRIVFVIFNALLLVIITKAFDVNVPIINSFEVTSIGSLLNIITPFRGGAGIRAVYLKQKFKLSYHNFVTTMLGTYVIVFLVSSTFGLLAIISYMLEVNQISYEVYILFFIFSAVIVAMLMIIFIDFKFIKRIKLGDSNTLLEKIKKLVLRINVGWGSIMRDREILLKIIIVTIGSYLVTLIAFYYELKAVNIESTLRGLITYSSLSSISLLISITPGSIGIKEAILVFSEQVMGVEGSKIVIVSLFERIINIISVLSLYLFSVLLIKLKKSN